MKLPEAFECMETTKRALRSTRLPNSSLYHNGLGDVAIFRWRGLLDDTDAWPF